MSKRVFVSGYGLCCGNGLDTEQYWDNCSNLRSGLRIEKGWEHLDCRVASLVDVEQLSEEERKEVEYYKARRSVFTRKALFEALAMSGLDLETLKEIGIILGIDFYGGDEFTLDFFVNVYPQGKGEDKWENFNLGYSVDRGVKRLMRGKQTGYADLLQSQTLFSYQPWIERYIRSLIQVPGISRTINNLCVSSSQSIGEAYHSIRSGEQDVILSGGLEEYSFVSAFTFSRLGVYVRADKPENSCTPFDARRKGTVLGEGAGFVVLESEDHLEKRGGTPIAEVVGYGTSNNCYHVTNSPPDGKGLAQAMNTALKRGAVAESDVDVVVAHGTGTYVNDLSECQAINDALPSKPLVHSMKSYVGHTLSLAGALNFITGLLEMKHGFVLPTLFLKNPSKNCDVNHVPAQGVKKEVKTVLSNAAGFGGFNATLVFRKVA
ncbi:beta-ketoacyl-[acyl-carrier-protein] synthase family protein [bacterium]|nr:beta-ketoacyl-[acyl-carrier-protein] synthase family protein [bacterium]